MAKLLQSCPQTFVHLGAGPNSVADGCGRGRWTSADENGNLVALLNASNGNTAAIYEYSAFGEVLRAETIGTTVAEQPFRFSTKFTDATLYVHDRWLWGLWFSRWLAEMASPNADHSREEWIEWLFMEAWDAARQSTASSTEFLGEARIVLRKLSDADT